MNVVIVGASSGLGRELAIHYINKGHRVALAARRTAPLEALAALAPERVVWAEIDVCNSEEAPRRLQELITRLGGLDVYVQSAGIGKMTSEMDFREELPTLKTNVEGWTACVLTAYDFLLKQGHGTLAAITSFSALRGLGAAPAYSATKAFQAHYLEALRQRLLAAGSAVRIVDLRPGFVSTPLLAHPERLFWVIRPARAAQSIVRAIERGRPVCTLTGRWRLFAPVFRLAPCRLIAKVLKSASVLSVAGMVLM